MTSPEVRLARVVTTIFAVLVLPHLRAEFEGLEFPGYRPIAPLKADVDAA